VRGALNWPRRDAKRMLRAVTKSDGTKFRDVDELRNALMDELSQGHEVIPMSDECEGFDYKTGCPGHESGDTASQTP
jgi:hypothetical protein